MITSSLIAMTQHVVINLKSANPSFDDISSGTDRLNNDKLGSHRIDNDQFINVAEFQKVFIRLTPTFSTIIFLGWIINSSKVISKAVRRQFTRRTFILLGLTYRGIFSCICLVIVYVASCHPLSES